MAEKQKCCGERWSHFRWVNCGHSGKIERDGKFYCGVHDPVRRKEKEDARSAKFETERAERKRLAAIAERRKRMYVEMAGALIAIAAGHNDAQAYARRIVDQYRDILHATAEKEKTDAASV
jgi:uncharacterized Zn finger protein (UPF0148 family)